MYKDVEPQKSPNYFTVVIAIIAIAAIIVGLIILATGLPKTATVPVISTSRIMEDIDENFDANDAKFFARQYDLGGDEIVEVWMYFHDGDYEAAARIDTSYGDYAIITYAYLNGQWEYKEHWCYWTSKLWTI